MSTRPNHAPEHQEADIDRELERLIGQWVEAKAVQAEDVELYNRLVQQRSALLSPPSAIRTRTAVEALRRTRVFAG